MLVCRGTGPRSPAFIALWFFSACFRRLFAVALPGDLHQELRTAYCPTYQFFQFFFLFFCLTLLCPGSLPGTLNSALWEAVVDRLWGSEPKSAWECLASAVLPPKRCAVVPRGAGCPDIGQRGIVCGFGPFSPTLVKPSLRWLRGPHLTKLSWSTVFGQYKYSPVAPVPEQPSPFVLLPTFAAQP